jgi:hypothetical protein
MMPQKSLAINRFEMTKCVIPNTYRFYPGNIVLKYEQLSKLTCNLIGNPWVDVGLADIEKQRAIVAQHAGDLVRHCAHPRQIVVFRHPIMVRSICDPDIVGGRRDADIDRLVGKETEPCQAVADRHGLFSEGPESRGRFLCGTSVGMA